MGTKCTGVGEDNNDRDVVGMGQSDTNGEGMWFIPGAAL